MNLDALSFPNDAPGDFGALPVDKHSTFGEELLGQGARNARHILGDGLVETQTVVLFWDREAVGTHNARTVAEAPRKSRSHWLCGDAPQLAAAFEHFSARQVQRLAFNITATEARLSKSFTQGPNHGRVEPMIAIGIDPGTRNLGWGVVVSEGNRLCHIAHGVIRVSAEEALSSRLRRIGDALDQLLSLYKPQVGSVEGIFFDKNAQSAAKLGHARGVVLLCLERADVKVREHSPARIKQTLTGNGRAEKSQVAHMVRAVLNLESAPPVDATDALAMAITELRIDPRAHLLREKAQKMQGKRMPPHLAEAVARAKAARGG